MLLLFTSEQLRDQLKIIFFNYFSLLLEQLFLGNSDIVLPTRELSYSEIFFSYLMKEMNKSTGMVKSKRRIV